MSWEIAAAGFFRDTQFAEALPAPRIPARRFFLVVSPRAPWEEIAVGQNSGSILFTGAGLFAPREFVLKEGLVKVGAVGDLAAGKMMRVRVGPRRILLANVDGRYFATDDTCTHEEASLSTGSLRGEFVKCPLHGSRFSVCTGEVMEEPASEDLKTYLVHVQDESIWIGLTGGDTP